MSWTDWLDLLGAAFIMLGAVFTAIAALGLIRFKGLFARMHAATKPQMLGLLLLCAGIAVTMRTWQWLAACILVLAIQTAAAPVASHLLSRTAYRVAKKELGYLTTNDLEDGTRL